MSFSISFLTPQHLETDDKPKKSDYMPPYQIGKMDNAYRLNLVINWVLSAKVGDFLSNLVNHVLIL